MNAVFIQILNMSISACYLVIAILLLRLALSWEQPLPSLKPPLFNGMSELHQQDKEKAL